MSTYLKFIAIAAIFLSASTASIFGHSQESAPSTTDQQIVQQSSISREKVTAPSKVETNQAESTSQSAVANSVVREESVTRSSEEAPAAVESSSVETEQAVTEATEATAAVNSRPAPTINEAEPTNRSEAAVEAKNEAQPQPAPMQANQLEINGQMISYFNAGQERGQAIIDANPNQVATWGGATTQSATDGANTHFIGHNPGIFNVLFTLEPGSVIDVSDGSNTVTSYTVDQIVTVDDYGMGEDGTDYWDQITGSGGGERITLQTCINDDYNLIVFAAK